MPTPDLSPPLNHVFVDVENVKVVDPEIIGGIAVKFTLLVGAQQKNLPVELVGKMMEHAASVQLIRLTQPGKNALDFALAYYLGQAVLSDPTGFFHLISKDKGYDPLIEHLRSRHIRVRRHDDYTTLTFLSSTQTPVILQTNPKPAVPAKAKVAVKIAAPAKQKPPVAAKPTPLRFEELNSRALTHLRSKTTGRPTRQKTLKTHLMDHFRKVTTESDVLKLINEWCSKGILETAEVQNAEGNFKITAYKL
ncbi:MAG: PIN domain-containing protein [Prosthecobacter sp.]